MSRSTDAEDGNAFTFSTKTHVADRQWILLVLVLVTAAATHG